ncbi:MAG: hypothetical protein HZC45_01845 [Deltaproteobacteria bacterium]|nr:hypothetical protein [Deltaproteobacteria bacterium]
MNIHIIDDISSSPEYEIYSDTKKTVDTKEKKEGELSFGDILDIINPFHHIPVVSTAYRFVTNDKISPVSKIIGGTIYGKVFGFIASVVNVMVETVTGKDIGDHVMTAIKGNQIKKYSEIEKILESKNHQTDSSISIIV